MQRNPFRLLAGINDMQCAICERSDHIESDSAAASILGANGAAGLRHMHGSRTVIVREPTARTEPADGMWTDVPGLALCTRWADCQNFVAFAPEHRVLGVLHAGWRGIGAAAIPAFVHAAQTEWGINATDLRVAAGPSLCLRCAEFTNPERELPTVPARLIQGRCVDLQQAATEQWLATGVRPEHLERHPDCTRCRPDRYWTYRGGDREAVANGYSNILVAQVRMTP